MRRPGAPEWISEKLLALLDGRLWHAADEAGWAGIWRDGAIRHDGPARFPNAFCRSIGAVSLFDLAQPDAAIPQAATHWSAWLGLHDDAPRYWLEVDREAAGSAILSPSDVLGRWRVALMEQRPELRLISGIEAGHLGPVPLSNVRRVLEVRRGGLSRVFDQPALQPQRRLQGPDNAP